MSKSYRVFTGAPPPKRTGKHVATSWQTVSSREVSSPLPQATLEQAGRRISLMYQNTIFEGGDGEEEDLSAEWESQNAIDCPPTHPIEEATRFENSMNHDLSRLQETFGTDLTGDGTTMFSEGSSVSRFPIFNFSLITVSSLSSIIHSRKPGSGSAKLSLLLGVLEVDGPSYVTVKTGPHAGSEVGLLKIIVGDEKGAVCKLVVWRETAEVWGGAEQAPGLERGDIVLFENVLVSDPPRRPEGLHEHERDSKIQITASPNLKSQAQICYRTLPHTYEDQKLRPDLRLADSVPAVRKVHELVTWMEQMAGVAVRT